MTADLRHLRHHSGIAAIRGISAVKERQRTLTLAAVVGVALVCALVMTAPALALVAVPSVTGMPNLGDGVTPTLGGDGIVAASSSWGLGGDYGLGDILGPNDIFTFDPSTGWGAPIAVAEGLQESPDACQSQIVWADNRSGDYDIYVHDTVLRDSGPLVVAPGDQKDPRTSEPIRLSTTAETWAVVWSDDRDAATRGWDVYCRQGVGGVFPVCTRAADQTDPDISGTTVVWVDTRNGNPDIYGATYDPVTLEVTEFPVCTNTAAQTACAVDGNWIVWIDRRSGSGAAYGYNRRTQSEFLIAGSYAGGTGDLYSPHEVDVSGDTAVWIEGSEGADSYLRGMNLTTGQRFTVRGRDLDPTAGVRVEGTSVVAYNPRFFGGIMGYVLGWGMELLVAGEPQWVTAPALTLEAAAATPDTWVTDVRFSANGGDTWSAWQALKATNSYTLPAGEGERTVTAQFRDHLDGVSPKVQTTVGVDTVAPTSGNDYDGLWHRTPVTVQLVASDATSGVARSEYRLDADSTWHTGDTVTVATPQDHSADGVHKVSYRSVDAAGNVEAAKSVLVKIDTRPPVTACNAPSGWVDHAVEVRFASSDAGCGVDYTEYDLDGGGWTRGGSVLVSGDGVHALSARSVDLLGHIEATRTFTVRIDSVGPSTEALANASVRRGRTATLRYRVNDALSPKAKVTIRIRTLRGRLVKSLPVVIRTTNMATSSRFTCKLVRGRYRFSIEARDLAGNRQVKMGYGALVVR